MGLRTRLKRRVQRILGKESSSSVQPEAAPPAPPTSAKSPAQTTVQPPPPAPTPPSPSAASAAPPAAPPSEADAKVARHFERTRRAVLRLVDTQGGTSTLAEMHDYSESKYFIGHKRFSDLMETLLDESLILFDHATGEAQLTEAGRTLAHTPMPPRKAATKEASD